MPVFWFRPQMWAWFAWWPRENAIFYIGYLMVLFMPFPLLSVFFLCQGPPYAIKTQFNMTASWRVFVINQIWILILLYPVHSLCVIIIDMMEALAKLYLKLLRLTFCAFLQLLFLVISHSPLPLLPDLAFFTGPKSYCLHSLALPYPLPFTVDYVIWQFLMI